MELKPGDLVTHVAALSQNSFAQKLSLGIVLEVCEENNWVDVYWFKLKRNVMHSIERVRKV